MPDDTDALRSTLTASGRLQERTLWGADARVPLDELAQGSCFADRIDALADRSVLVATGTQLGAALALIELDGVARRIVVCPPDLPPEHLPGVIATGEVDALVSDHASELDTGLSTVVPCSTKITPGAPARTTRHRTEWVLLTSGTTGAPKLVVHTRASLTDVIVREPARTAPSVWSTFYDIRRYGGLQILLRALLGGGSLVLSDPQESTGDYLTRVRAHGVTHISGTPSHWRRALMSPLARTITPRYVRLSGEIADQAVLDHLHALYPAAAIAHAFASTEAGVAFAVGDGRAGFPASLVEQVGAPVEDRKSVV